MSCVALVRTDVGGIPGGYHGLYGSAASQADVAAKPDATATAPPGYGPSQLQTAYNLPSSSAGTGQTVALVESGDYPTAAADLTTYRAEYGLPACTVANGCFEKVGQTGSTTSLPAENAGWAEETALDQDMVSATCPNCHILIVEANSSSNANLAAAENEAVALGANEVSNSYGGSETGATNSAYSHAGVVILASAGDSGYAEGSQQPCSYATVVCTGGTSLRTATNSRGYTEVVWNDLSTGNGATGSGCSSDVAKPSWQNDKGCTKRSQSDVSFDADPEYGVAVYDSTPYQGYSGWLEFGGTSVASPALAGVFALAGNASSLGTSAAATFWNDKGTGLNSVTSGNNLTKRGKCGSAYAYICTAGTGTDGVYSGPAGWGTPNGLSDF
jgi:subtilase family serine protease